MVEIRVERETSAPPQVVLDTLREPDLERRHRFWSGVVPKHSKVHDSGETFIDVTEANFFVVGVFSERSRYEWSEPGAVVGTVLESNVFQPGSTFTLRARPRPGGGSSVELHIRRTFQRGLKGSIAAAINHVAGRPLFRWYLRDVLRAAEEEAG